MIIRNNVVIPTFLVYNSDDYYTYLINSINTKYNYINEQILRDGSVVILLQGNVDKTYFMIPVDIFKLCFEYISTRATICEQSLNREVYITRGHGCQYSYYKTLPANCMYLSLALGGFNTNIVTARRILNLFEYQSEMLQNPCKNFRKLNDYLTVSLHNADYNEKMNPDKISPDKLYDKDNSTYLNIHYNDPSQELNKYLEIYHDVLGYYDPTSNPNAISNDYLTFWKSGLYKMSSSNYGFDNVIMCVVGDYFNDVILHDADIYFMFFNSLRPTYSEALESINAHKKSYYTEITSLDTTINYAPIDRIDDETIDDFYFVQYKTSDVITPKTYVRININQNVKTLITNNFEPLISGNDLIIIMKKWNIKQSELFEMYPGIHYNVNCRSNCTDISSDINETLKKTSVENKRKVFENIYSAEEDKRMIDAKQQTEKFKSGVNHNDLLSRAKFALNIAEKRGSTKFEKAENYGHKLKSKKSKSIFKLFSKRRSSSSSTKRKNRI